MKIVIQPRVMPRNATDILIAVLVAGLQISVLLIAPSMMVVAVFGSSLLGLISFVSLYAPFLAFSVWKISLDETGITLSRFLGTPRFIDWNQVEAIVPVTRGELIAKGWLWPLFPAREMTASLTSTEHYKINFAGKYIYYPPLEPEAFEDEVRKRWGPI